MKLAVAKDLKSVQPGRQILTSDLTLKSNYLRLDLDVS